MYYPEIGISHDVEYEMDRRAYRHVLRYGEYYQAFYLLEGLRLEEQREHVDREIEIFIRRLGSSYKHKSADPIRMHGTELWSQLFVGLCGDSGTNKGNP